MKLTKRQEYWLEIIRKQGGIYKAYDAGGLTKFKILNQEKQASQGPMERLFRSGVLIPSADGLFGDSQVYKAPRD